MYVYIHAHTQQLLAAARLVEFPPEQHKSQKALITLPARLVLPVRGWHTGIFV